MSNIQSEMEHIAQLLEKGKNKREQLEALVNRGLEHKHLTRHEIEEQITWMSLNDECFQQVKALLNDMGIEVTDDTVQRESQWIECPDGRKINRRTFEAALQKLTPREETIVKMRLGLTDGKIYSLEEISKEAGISRERILYIESKVFGRHHEVQRRKKLKDYLD